MRFCAILLGVLLLTGFGAADPALEGQLRSMAAKRMPVHEMELFNVVDYRGKHFGLATYNTRDDARADLGRISIWEHVDGKWSFIFDYQVPQVYAQGNSPKAQVRSDHARRDALFARHGFSPVMRARLESKIKQDWGGRAGQPRRPGQLDWPDFLE